MESMHTASYSPAAALKAERPVPELDAAQDDLMKLNSALMGIRDELASLADKLMVGVPDKLPHPEAVPERPYRNGGLVGSIRREIDMALEIRDAINDQIRRLREAA